MLLYLFLMGLSKLIEPFQKTTKVQPQPKRTVPHFECEHLHEHRS